MIVNPHRPGCRGRARQAGGRRASTTVSLLLACLLPAMAIAQIAFQEVTTSAGINLSGRSMGLAWGDSDGDGWPDLYTSHHAAIDVLYHNNRNGTFTNVFPGDITNPSTPDTHGSAFGDFDNDGDQDIMQLSGAQKGTGSSPNELYVFNHGIATNEAQARGVLDEAGRGRTPLWLDWNNDGLLDLFFANLKRPDGLNPSAYFEQTPGSSTEPPSRACNPRKTPCSRRVASCWVTGGAC